MKIRAMLLGTGGAEIIYKGILESSYRRAHTSCLIEIETVKETKYIQIDYTSHADIGLLKAGIMPSAIDFLCFSHSHEDHFVPYRFVAGKIGSLKLDPNFSKKYLSVFGPGPVMEALNSMLMLKGHRPEKSSLVYKNEINGKEVLSLYGAKPDEVIQLSPNIELKFIGVRHFYKTSYAAKGWGKIAFGFLITVKEADQSQSVFYLPDFADFKEEEKKSIFQSFEGYQINLAIFGMPVPFPSLQKRKEHMGLASLLNFLKECKERNIIKKESVIVLNHLSDRWEIPDVLTQAKKTINYIGLGNKVWLPKEDGLVIIVEKGKVSRRGKLL